MKNSRRNFIKTLGLGAIASTVPLSLVGTETDKEITLEDSAEAVFEKRSIGGRVELGKNGQEFLLHSTVSLEKYDVLTYDVLYGQQIVVREYLGEGIYSVVLCTNDREEFISSEFFNKDIKWNKIYSTSVSGALTHPDWNFNNREFYLTSV